MARRGCVVSGQAGRSNSHWMGDCKMMATSGRFRRISNLIIGQLIAAMVLTSWALELRAQALEEIIVTSTRRAQSLQDIPYNISAITGDQMEAANVTSLVDLTRTIPGIAYADLGVRSAGVNNQLILRGVNANAQGSINAYLGNLTPAGVSTYLGNTPIFINLAISDLERVEVLRGPQGTLFGAGSVGGTIRFIFNEPNPEAFDAAVDVDIGSTEDADDLNYRLEGFVNAPLGESAALRIAGGYKELAGVVDGRRLAVGGFQNPQVADPADPFGTGVLTEQAEDIDDADQWFVRTSLLWNISEEFQAQFIYQRQEESADGFSFQTDAASPGAEERVFDQYFISPMDREIDLFALELDYDFGFARLESSTSFTSNEEETAGDLSGLAMINDAIRTAATIHQN